MLEENHCFDAETYADELEPEESLHFREDQRSTYSDDNHLQESSIALYVSQLQAFIAVPLVRTLSLLCDAV